MPAKKVVITIDQRLLNEVDQLVESGAFPSRSRAIQSALEESLLRRRRSRLAEECAKLNPEEEKSWAEWGTGSEGVEWPTY